MMAEHIIWVWTMRFDGSEQMNEYRCDCPLPSNHDETDPDYQAWLEGPRLTLPWSWV